MTSIASVRILKAIGRATRNVSIAGAIAWVLVVLRWKFFRRARGKPFIPGHWLLGTFPAVYHAAARNEVHKFLFEIHKLLGPTLIAVPPLGLPANVVITADPQNVEHILKTRFENYPKGSEMRHRFLDLLGTGIFNADGQQWQQQRKTTSHMFTAKLFKEHIWAVVSRNSRSLRSILQSTDPDKVVDIFNLMNRFTLDTIGEVGFGKCIGSLDDPSSPFLSSFDKAQQITMYRFILPPGTWEFMRFAQLGTERETKEHFSRLDGYSRSVVRELQKSFERGSDKTSGVAWGDLEAKKSFVGLFLADAEKRGETVSEDYLRDLVLNFLIAGRDTTAQALSWTFFCLCTHPAVEAKAREEVIEVCGVRDPSYDDLNRLPYINAVLSEALRLYPSVPIDAKQALEDDVWPDGTIVPKNTIVWYNIFSMGRDPAIWGDDAEEFRPERWLERRDAPDNFHYPVFNGGPRECLGRRLAMVEMKACLAMLLPHISLTLAVPADQICTDSQLTIGMGRGLPCFVASTNSNEDAKSNMSTAVQSESTSFTLGSDGIPAEELDMALSE